MPDHTNLHKEIDLIQACITRMAQNSFYLKGWYISLMSIVITLLLGQGCKIKIAALVVMVITIVFWGLDAFFLKTETFYRWKYEWVIQDRLKEDSTHEFLYDLNPYRKEMWVTPNSKSDCFFKFVFSKTLVPLYGIPFISCVSIIFYNILF